MTYEHLTLECEGRLSVVRLNRPAVRNALSQALMRELTHCAHELAERTDVDVVILTGSDACFSGGADLKDARAWADTDMPLVARRQVASLGFRMCKAWEEMPQITLVAIEGFAVGGGLALSLACDWRVLADDAFVSLPEIALGIPLTWGTIPRLTNLCERIPAAQALAMGLVDYTAPKGHALAQARRVAAQTLAMPAASVRMSKESVNAGATALNHASGYMAHDQIALAAGSDESRAAREAALSRNAPRQP